MWGLVIGFSVPRYIYMYLLLPRYLQYLLYIMYRRVGCTCSV